MPRVDKPSGIIRAMTRILGIVGGTGPESTVDYYRSVVASWRRRNPDGSHPRVIINSVEAGRIFRWLDEREFSQVAQELTDAVRELAAAGAGAALLASNATHLAFDEVEAAASIPLIHIVDATRDAAQAHGHHRLGILGTRFVMEAAMYPERFNALGMTVVLPRPDEMEYVHDRYFGELVQGSFLDDTRDGLVAIIETMRARDEIDGVILGGTELALILPNASYAGVPILNTVQIHVEAAVDWLLGEREDRPIRP